MDINQNTFAMLCDLETIIANSCYNPNSYDGYTDEEGRSFRYPLTVVQTDEDGEEYEIKVRHNLNKYNFDDIEVEEFKHGKYKFGSNHLYIVVGLRAALTYLEKRYDLDFEELELSLLEDVGEDEEE